MRYALLIYIDEPAAQARSAAEVQAAMVAHMPYIERLRRNGRYVASEALGTARSARIVRSAAGKPLVTEGPFAESREQFGGFYMVEAGNLDEAIEVASECPALGTIAAGIEIRPIPQAGASTDASAALARDRYLLAVHVDATACEISDDEVTEGALKRWQPYVERLRASGHLSVAESFSRPGSATSVRIRDGKVVLTDGPFLERREQMGGFCIVWARTMDDAVGLACAFPDAREHIVEVRPVRVARG
ncbi:MAG TPA: YciI family protein [Methylomirabilota bacterium]|nr:YciI family protein [Methylomirabilota bacterium]